MVMAGDACNYHWDLTKVLIFYWKVLGPYDYVTFCKNVSKLVLHSALAIFTAVTLKITSFWDSTSCSLAFWIFRQHVSSKGNTCLLPSSILHTRRVQSWGLWFTHAFAKLRKATLSFVMSVRQYVYPHGRTQLDFGGFWWNLMFELFFFFENLSRKFKFY